MKINYTWLSLQPFIIIWSFHSFLPIKVLTLHILIYLIAETEKVASVWIWKEWWILESNHFRLQILYRNAGAVTFLRKNWIQCWKHEERWSYPEKCKTKRPWNLYSRGNCLLITYIKHCSIFELINIEIRISKSNNTIKSSQTCDII